MSWLVAAVLFLVVPGVQVALAVTHTFFFTAKELLDTVAAILAYFWVLNAILLSLKIPVMQRLLPYDRAVRLHILASTGVALLILAHAFSKILGGKLIDLLSWGLLAAFFTISLLAVSWIRTRIFGWVQRFAMRHLGRTLLGSYDWMREAHGILFALMAIGMYVHVLRSNILFLVPIASVVVYHAWFAVVIAMYLFAKMRQIVLRPLRVKSIRTTGGIHVIRFAGTSYGFRAGQFGFVSFLGNDLAGESHPFSFLSHDPRDLEIAVKPLGDHTSQYHQVAEGDAVRINGPFGNFHPPARGPLCLIGSGIGIVPILSILKHLAAHGDQRRVEVFLAVTERSELLEPDAIEAAQREMPNLTVRILVFSEDGTLFNEEFFRDQLQDTRRQTFMVCSSRRVRGVVVDALGRLGVRRHKIRFEDFAFGA